MRQDQGCEGGAMQSPTVNQTFTNTEPKTKLNGSLGVGSIVFMVIAAAAPLTVVGGNVPLAFNFVR